MMEYRIAKLISGFVGSSFLATATVLGLIIVIAHISRGDYEVLISFTTLKWIVWSVLYIVSIYLVYSIKGKSPWVRTVYWGFSISFHSALLFYLAVILNWGTAVFAIGFVEFAIVILSVIGLGLCIRSTKKDQS